MKKQSLTLSLITYSLILPSTALMGMETKKTQKSPFLLELEQKLRERKISVEEPEEQEYMQELTLKIHPSKVPSSLEESFINTPEASEQDLGWWFAIRRKTNYPRHMILTDLTNGSFNPHALQYRGLLDNALQDCIDSDDHDSLIQILNLVTEKYNKQVMPADDICEKVHAFINQKMTEDHRINWTAIKQQNLQFGQECFSLLTTLVATHKALIETLEKSKLTHQETQKQTIEQLSDTIRPKRRAHGLLHLHNRTFNVTEGESCYDYTIENGRKVRKSLETIEQECTYAEISKKFISSDFNKHALLQASEIITILRQNEQKLQTALEQLKWTQDNEQLTQLLEKLTTHQ